MEIPKVIQVESRPTASIHLVIPRDDCRQLFGPAVSEVMKALAAQGLKPAGALFSYHLKNPGDIFDFEIGVPVSEPFEATGRVKASHLPASQVAVALYQGGFEGLGSAWGELDRWIRDNDMTPASSLWETYLAGPEISPNPDDWRTELTRPLLA